MKIGITGGIGSGKSFVCQRLKAQGIEVFDCDNAAKTIMRNSPDIRKKLCELIGPDTYNEDGSLNKSAVSHFLLSSSSNAKAIDNIVHPAVFEAFQESGLNFMESAILFESGAYKLVDKVVAVVAPLEVRIQRVMQRDNISREKALDWMNRQMNQDEVARKADFVVINDGETDLENQIIKIIEQCNKQF